MFRAMQPLPSRAVIPRTLHRLSAVRLWPRKDGAGSRVYDESGANCAGTASAHGRRTTILVLAGGLGMGGSERQLLLLLSVLSRTEAFELHVLAFNHDASFVLNQSLEDLGVRVWMVPLSCTGKLERLWFLQRLVLEIKPDVIHSWAFHTNAYAGIVGVTAGVKGRIGSLRSSLSLAEEGLGRPMALVSLFSVPQLVVNSKSIERDVVAAGYPAARVMLLENCVPCSTTR